GPSEITRKEYDLVLVDEAHRLRRRVNLGTYYRAFDKGSSELGLNEATCTELDWILQRSKKSVFFYDEDQSIKPSDVRREAFEALKRQPNTKTGQLQSQFRVLGGNGYVNFVKKLLNGKLSLEERPACKNYEVLLFHDIRDLIGQLKEKERDYGLARLVAGYSWPWISKTNKAAFDIHINGTELRWNSVSDDWLNSPNATEEVGCIHTTQGYDINYTGIIFGREIGYDPETGEIIIRKENYHDKNGKQSITDPDELKAFILNIYQTLMLRGIRGTYIYACDENLRDYFAGHIQTYSSDPSIDRKSTRLNSSHVKISYAVFCLTPPPPSSPLFPYTTLFRSKLPRQEWKTIHYRPGRAESLYTQYLSDADASRHTGYLYLCL